MKPESVFGIHAVTAFIQKQPDAVVKVYFSSGRKDDRLARVKQLAREKGLQCDTIEADEFRRRFEQWNHQGVVAHFTPVPPMTEPEMLDMLAALETPALVLVLDQITDPHNFGAILRTADAAGVHCVVVPKNASVGLTPVVRKVASGAAESVRVCRVANLARCLGELKSLGLWLFGAAAEPEAVDYHKVDYTSPVAIVMGAEGKGIRRLSRESCDQLIEIPMSGTVSSLNVSVATGVCLYEVVRQRLGQ